MPPPAKLRPLSMPSGEHCTEGDKIRCGGNGVVFGTFLDWAAVRDVYARGLGSVSRYVSTEVI